MLKFRFLLLLLLLISLAYLVNLSSFGLTEPDEGRYAEAAREMLELRSYLVPYHNYKPRLVKPPMFYWFVMASYKVLGVSETSARLVSIAFSFLTALFLAVSVARFTGYLQGATTALVFLAFPYTFTISHLAIPDPTLCFFITASSYTFFIFAETGNTIFRTVSYLFMAFGVLTKGPVALIPLGSTSFYLLAAKRPKEVKKLFSLFDILLLISISLPWFLYISSKVEKGFFFRETLGRFLKGTDHKEPFYFFIPYLLFGAVPFIAFLPSAKFTPSKPLFLFSAVHAAFVFTFFSLSSCKLPSYIFPAFPPLAVLVSFSARDLKKPLFFCAAFFLFIKLFLLPIYGERLSIRPLFKGKSFEREASFYYFKKPYKAYPFYVKKRVLKFQGVEKMSHPSYLLISEKRLRGAGLKTFIKVSETVYKRKKLFLLKRTR